MAFEHVYLAPHIGAAVFSCGGAIARHRALGRLVLVITAFATDEVARREDRTALEFLDVPYQWQPGALDDLVRDIEPNARLHVPLGLGGSHLHELTRGRDVELYEDIPAALAPGSVEMQLAALGGGLEPVVTDITAFFDTRIEAMRQYASQRIDEQLVVDYLRGVGKGIPSERSWRGRL